MKRAEYRALCCTDWFSIGYCVYQHGDTKGIGQQNKLLSPVVTPVTYLSQEVDCLSPFFVSWLNLLYNAVQVGDYRGHYFFEAGIVTVVEPRKGIFSNFVVVHVCVSAAWVCRCALGGYFGNLAYSISNSNYGTYILIVNDI